MKVSVIVDHENGAWDYFHFVDPDVQEAEMRISEGEHIDVAEALGDPPEVFVQIENDRCVGWDLKIGGPSERRTVRADGPAEFLGMIR